MTRLVLGIDPGVTGAVAAITEHGEFVACFDLPISRDGKLAWVNGEDLMMLLAETRDGRHVARAFVERQQPMPGNGATSNVTIGCGLGSILAVLQVTVTSYELVTPAKWKAEVGVTADKRSSLDRARALFPAAPLDRMRDNGRAEALLIAEWGRRRVLGHVIPERDWSSWKGTVQ